MDKTPLQELIEFMADNLYRGNAIIYGKALELLEKEQELVSRAYDAGRHNGMNVYTNEPVSGDQYYNAKYAQENVN